MLAHWSFFWILSFAFGASAAPRIAWTSNRVIGSPNPPAPYTVERLHPQLTFNNPLDLTFVPGTDRLFIAEQSGKLWSMDTRATNAQPQLAFDLRKHHQPLDNILGFTFHPGFATNRFIFINYNEPPNRTNGAHVSRFTLHASTPPTVDPSSERVIIRWLSGGHNGCTLAFGPDGFLYISTGDTDDPDPPDGKHKTGQDISDLLACILRIDVDRTDGTNAYAIPADNPFRATSGARPEVWAFGLRNPWRMSFAPDGALWVGDVGFEQWEMIYRARAGGNYGWSLTEGPNQRVRTDVKQGPGPILPPMVSHPHSEAASITGGRFYRGRKLPKLRGAYVYGDWETGKFWALRHDGDKLVSVEELCDTTLQPISFAEAPDGELLVLDYRGGLYTFAPNNAPPPNAAFPRRLSETGLFRDVAKLAPAPGVVTYQPAAGMWSDYASADRHLGVPETNVIVTADGRQTIAGKMWDWPTNTVFTRTLTLEQLRGKPATARRIETQLLHYDGQAWNGYSFRWNKDQTDAELVPAAGTNDTFTMTDATAPGGRREIPWRFLGRTECLRCHQCWANDTLSFSWLQLGSPKGGAKEPSELQRLAELGLLRIKNPPKEQQHLVDPYDQTQFPYERARSWLHVNCSGCHRFNGGGVVPLHLNYEKRGGELRALNERPTRGDFGLDDARIIANGSPYRSTLFYRVLTEGAGHMPAIGSRLADPAIAGVLSRWITGLGAGSPEENGAVNYTFYLGSRAAELVHALFTNAPGQLSTANRSEALWLMDKPSGAFALFYRLARNGLSPETEAALARLAQDHTNALVRDLFQSLLPPGERRQTLGTEAQPQTILARNGDAARGREIFTGVSQCARCHALGGVGRAFGTDLAGIGKKYNRAQLLDHILNPSKFIAPEFKSITITLRDESELTGFILKRSATGLVLRDEKLNEHAIKLSDVKEQRESTLSAMPEGLLAPLTAQEAADLLEFLATSQSP